MKAEMEGAPGLGPDRPVEPSGPTGGGLGAAGAKPPSPPLPQLEAEDTATPPPGGEAMPGQPVAEMAAAAAAVRDAENVAQINARDARIERAFLAGKQVIDYSTHLHSARERAQISDRSFPAIDAKQLELKSAGTLVDAATAAVSEAALGSKRLLVVSGEPRLGKSSFALVLADRLLGCAEGVTEACVCTQRLERDLRVPLADLASQEGCLAGRVVIFRDALACENAELLALFRGLDELSLGILTRKLADARAFVIFTTASLHLDDRLAHHLKALGILTTLVPPAPERLADLLLRRATELSWLLALPAEEAAQAHDFLSAHAGVIVAALRTPPRLEDFLRERLQRVLRHELPLDEALARGDDLAPWLLGELPDSFDAWCYVLALILGGASPLFSTVPWLTFERLRRQLGRWLSRELGSTDAERPASALCGDEALLARATAQIQPLGADDCIAIRFEDPTRAAHLWKALLSAGRHLLAVLLPFLSEILDSGDPGLTAVAARALGRIGELDRHSVFNTYLEQQLASGQLRRCVAAGQLLQGALGSSDSAYRAASGDLLERHACGADSTRAVMAILASFELAEVDLALVLRMLRAALEAWLVECLDDLGTFAARLAAVERYFRLQEALHWGGEEPRHLQDLTMYLVPALFTESQFEIFRALKVTLSRLCASPACAKVLADLAAWVGDGGKHHRGALTALLFLDFFGIAEGVDGSEPLARRREAGAPPPPLGAELLAWLMPDGSSRCAVLAKFFDGMHQQIGQYPAQLHHALRQRWVAVLKGWAGLAAAGDPARPLVVELLSRLMPTATQGMSDVGHEIGNLIQLLQTGSDAGKAALAREVLAWTPPA